MKKIFYLLVVVVVLNSCGSNGNDGQGNNVSIQSNALPGFNVNNFANLVKKTTNPTDIENQINQDGNDVNNLDLNKDGKVDFLKVSESENKIQVTDDVDANNSVNVATMTVNKNQADPNTADMQIQGNPSYCGQNYQYQSHVSLGEVLLLAYIFSPHRYYVPMYHYGYYPPYYRGYATSSYRTVTHTYTTSRNVGSSPTARPFTPSRSSLSNPNHSQRSFSARDNSAPVHSGGFGNSSSKGTSIGTGSSSSSSRSTFGSGSKSSFGSGRSSFGSGRSSFGGGRSGFGRRR